MIFPKPVIDPDAKIDFYAGNDRSYRRLVPLWEALDGRRGTFFASRMVHQDDIPLQHVTNKLDGFEPIVISSYKDLNDIFIIGEERPFIMLELDNSKETRGLLEVVSLFLCQDERTFDFRRAISDSVMKVNGTQDTARKIISFMSGKNVEYVTHIDGHSVGVVMLGWGEKALEACKKSMATLRRLGTAYPVTIIGDFPYNDPGLDRFNLVQCNVSPFDLSKHKNFKFRAGRVKPAVYELSPYEFSLYIDADTHFIQPIHEAFKLLCDYDFVVTDEKLTLAELYNKKLAGWELNMLERDATIIELGDNDGQKFINSGVMLFRKNNKVKELFKDWHKEWLRFQEWDEQLALMRSIYHHPEVNVKHLSTDWNSPHLTEATIIFHNYGRGDVRADV